MGGRQSPGQGPQGTAGLARQGLKGRLQPEKARHYNQRRAHRLVAKRPPFLCFALAYVCNDLAQSGRRWKPAVYSLTAGAVGLYALFYPELIGLQVPTWFTRTFLRWFSSWPL